MTEKNSVLNIHLQILRNDLNPQKSCMHENVMHNSAQHIRSLFTSKHNKQLFLLSDFNSLLSLPFNFHYYAFRIALFALQINAEWVDAGVRKSKVR